jgi:hypothetical protein
MVLHLRNFHELYHSNEKFLIVSSVKIRFSIALANDIRYENFLPPILSFGFETIYLFHKENNLSLAFKLIKKYRNNLLLIGKIKTSEISFNRYFFFRWSC